MKTRSLSASESYARMHGTPGARARVAGLARVLWPFVVAAAAAGFLLRAAFPLPAIERPTAGLLLVLLGATVVVLCRILKPLLESFLKGARGEEWVARELQFLPSAYEVFHGVEVPLAQNSEFGGDCDHVVVGPSGIFVVETKNWSGCVTVENGRVLYDGLDPSRSPLNQVKESARLVREFLVAALQLEIAVTPVLCLAANTLDGKTQGVGGVIVCNARFLNAVIEQSTERPLEAAFRENVAKHLRGRVG